MSPYPTYKTTSLSELEAKKDRSLKRLKAKNLSPIVIEGKKLGSTWWGKAWNENLESYADFANRVGRGKTYVRRGLVLHLVIQEGQVYAMVQGSRKDPYEVLVKINPSSEEDLARIAEISKKHLESFESLLHGEFPKDLAVLFTRKGFGLFPSPNEIGFYCSCPDHADMCKHVAATLYGIGSKLDEDPQLFFTLRQINSADFIKESVEEVLKDMLKQAGMETKRTLPKDKAYQLFGLEEESEEID